MLGRLQFGEQLDHDIYQRITKVISGSPSFTVRVKDTKGIGSSWPRWPDFGLQFLGDLQLPDRIGQLPLIMQCYTDPTQTVNCCIKLLHYKLLH